MREAEQTTRQRIAEYLREETATASELAVALDLTPHAVVSHIEHVAKTLDGTGEQLLVAPPTCRECGFDRFDDPVNLPSRCPECKSESLDQPAFRVEAT
ncbi:MULTISPECIES: transcriptional regulator [unclassified Haladaptatus]|uniref:transcriptional regulator n=1 Tax=unclassified Haladaptatus TaxID=2622732 RepID=UPI0023E8A46A|nr:MULTISPECIES: transcriptional regulator [unclassified Haladaptatus]